MAFHRLTRTHPRLSLAAAVGLAGAWLIPAGDTVQHILAGWNLGVWLYLLLVLYLSWTASPEKVRKVAGVEDENAGLVLLTVCIAAIASLAAVTLQLVSSRGLQGTALAVHYLYTGLTVAGSWLLIGCIFTLHYARLFYTGQNHEPHCASLMASATRITGTSTTSRSPSAWRCKPRTWASPGVGCGGWCWRIRWWASCSIRRFWGSLSTSLPGCWVKQAARLKNLRVERQRTPRNPMVT